MSRSRRKTPIGSWSCSVSEKDDKQLAHRSWRRAVKTKLRYVCDETELPTYTEVADPWNWSKDGKGWFDNLKNDPDPYWQRYYRKAMRK